MCTSYLLHTMSSQLQHLSSGNVHLQHRPLCSRGLQCRCFSHPSAVRCSAQLTACAVNARRRPCRYVGGGSAIQQPSETQSTPNRVGDLHTTSDNGLRTASGSTELASAGRWVNRHATSHRAPVSWYWCICIALALPHVGTIHDMLMAKNRHHLNCHYDGRVAECHSRHWCCL